MNPALPATLIAACSKAGCREGLRGILEPAGYRVLEAANGREALELVRSGGDLVLLGLDLPDVDGLEVCRRIKSDPANSRVPVIHVCAEVLGDAAVGRSLEAGAEACFPRAMDSEVLLATVETLLRVKTLEEERDRLFLGEEVALRRRLDEAVRLSEQRFRVALRNSPIAVWNQDRDLRYTWVYNLLWTASGADPVGRTDEQLLPDQDISRMLAVKRQVLATGKGVREELSLAVGGEVRTYDMTLEPLHNQAGAVAGLTGAAVDVTATKRLEAKLRQAQKLESIGVLAGGVAHDFNNLLTGIMGNAGLLAEFIPQDHLGRAHLDAVIQGAERAAELTNQLLAYGGRGQFVREAVDLSRTVKEMLSLLRSSVLKTVHLHLSLKEPVPAVMGDSTQFRQILMNLVINAGEAIGEVPGTVRINTGVQVISPYYIERNAMAASQELEPGPYVYLEVRDTGCGMEPETIARVFDPFFTTKFTGRGLGLAAVQGIVRGHRGTIELYSTPGRGTTFKVLFPAAGQQEEEMDAHVSEEAVAGYGAVLAVDDNDLVRQLTQAVLERRGYTVLLAADAEQAVQVFRANAHEIVAVLLDARTPDVGGPAVLAELRRMRPDVPVVLSSGYPESEARKLFPGERDCLFIPKPYTARKLAETIAAAVGRSEKSGVIVTQGL